MNQSCDLGRVTPVWVTTGPATYHKVEEILVFDGGRWPLVEGLNRESL